MGHPHLYLQARWASSCIFCSLSLAMFVPICSCMFSRVYALQEPPFGVMFFMSIFWVCAMFINEFYCFTKNKNKQIGSVGLI